MFVNKYKKRVNVMSELQVKSITYYNDVYLVLNKK